MSRLLPPRFTFMLSGRSPFRLPPRGRIRPGYGIQRQTEEGRSSLREAPPSGKGDLPSPKNGGGKGKNGFPFSFPALPHLFLMRQQAERWFSGVQLPQLFLRLGFRYRISIPISFCLLAEQ